MRKQALYYKRGDWNADCDRCGFTYKGSELRKEWTGLRVCRECWEPRHPQDLLRGVPDRQAPEWTRPPDPNPIEYGVTSTEGNSLTDENALELVDESNEQLTDESGDEGSLIIPDVQPGDL